MATFETIKAEFIKYFTDETVIQNPSRNPTLPQITNEKWADDAVVDVLTWMVQYAIDLNEKHPNYENIINIVDYTHTDLCCNHDLCTILFNDVGVTKLKKWTHTVLKFVVKFPEIDIWRGTFFPLTECLDNGLLKEEGWINAKVFGDNINDDPWKITHKYLVPLEEAKKDPEAAKKLKSQLSRYTLIYRELSQTFMALGSIEAIYQNIAAMQDITLDHLNHFFKENPNGLLFSSYEDSEAVKALPSFYSHENSLDISLPTGLDYIWKYCSYRDDLSDEEKNDIKVKITDAYKPFAKQFFQQAVALTSFLKYRPELESRQFSYMTNDLKAYAKCVGEEGEGLLADIDSDHPLKEALMKKVNN